MRDWSLTRATHSPASWRSAHHKAGNSSPDRRWCVRTPPALGASRRRRGSDQTAEASAGIVTKLGNHSLRATGITAYLKNGRRDEVSLDEVGWIVI
jgi:hypothetical protein